MLRVLGSYRQSHGSMSRRDLLQAGSLGVLGLALPELLRMQHAAQAAEQGAVLARSFGRAKSCILLYLYGAASQLETFDVKPDAPREIRGELGATSTAIPGVQIGELLPLTARMLDRTTIVRSMTHPFPLHAVAYSVTSNPQIDVPMQMNPRDPRHWPFIGSVVDYMAQHDPQAPPPKIPRNVCLPWRLSSRRQYAAGDNAGPFGAFLGAAYDPVCTDFHGEGSRKSTYTFGPDTITCFDPYGPLKSGYRFDLSAAQLPDEITLDRLNRRRSLLAQFDDARQQRGNDRTQSFDRYQELAMSLLTSTEMRTALDVHREPERVRERYGTTLFGQSSLVARRLVEAGAKLVSVFWDEFGLVNSAWDTHFYHYSLMKEQLCPGFDAAFSTLVLDLEERGLLDETLVVCITEHGRTPKIKSTQGGGRDHWSRAYCSALAGGGIARGRVVGRTDRTAGEVVDTPVSPKDILATMYHLLGISPHAMIHDRLGRPLPVAGEGRVVTELLA